MPIQTDQIVSEDTLSSLGTTAREKLSAILVRMNNELDSPLRMHASHPTADSQLTFSPSVISLGDGSSKSVPALKSQVFNLVATSIDFQAQSTSGATVVITWPTSTLNFYRRVGFTLLSSGSIQALFSAEASSVGALANAGTLFVKSGLAIGYIDLKCTNAIGLFKTANSVTNVIENAGIYRFSSGSGTGSGTSGSGGGELSDLMFSCAVRDSFTDILDGTTPTDIASGKTDSNVFDSSNELIRLNYDASKTTHAATPCTTTSISLASAPGFTVKLGDVIIFDSEVRRITTVTSQVLFTVEAFTTAPGLAVAINISQCLHTVDLNNFTNGGLGQSAASQYTDNIDEIMIGYADSSTLGDIIPDFGNAAVIGFTASTDTSSWTTTKTRVASLSQQEVALTCPTSNPNLYLRFFANKTTGSGAVNLLSYKAFFQKIFGQTVGGTYYTAFARPTSSIAQNCSIGLVSGKTRFTFTFPYSRGLNSSEASGSVLEVIGNGQIVPRFTSGVTDSAQAYFTEINDNTIEMDTDYTSAGIDFQFKVQRVGIIDTNTLNTTKIALHDDLLDQSLDAQIVPTFRTAINGTPNETSFRSDITNRASIPDLSAMLSVQMGPARMMTQEIYAIQGEFGPAGQQVFGVVNDKFNQIRFVGAWVNVNSDNGQAAMSSASLTDYVEIVFYGTGLNLLNLMSSSQRDMRISIDGGSESANFYPASGSSILNARNYSSNIIMNVASGLSLGFHTVKIRNNSASNLPIVFGFEVLTETTSLRVTPGTIMKGKYKNSLSALQTIAFDSAFESGTLGTKGGCAVIYLKNDGTIGKAVTPTDASAGYLTGASHVNEEVIRVHHFREFGAGRSDDFSIFATSGSNTNRAFTLDDGVTTLVASNAAGFTLSDGEYLVANIAAGFITLTFVGTGLDIVRRDSVNAAGSVTIFIDGVSVGSLSDQVATRTTVRICSGLPYGTHTVRFLINTLNYNFGVAQFIVYAPKKPILPVGSIELAQYYKMADYVANTTAGLETISTGVIRKQIAQREATFVGTWSFPNPVTPSVLINGWEAYATTIGSYVEYTFFGTGFELRGRGNAAYSANVILSIDGIAGFNAYTSSTYGGYSIVNSTTGQISQAVGVNGSGLRVSGLSLGKHTIRFTANAINLSIEAFDIISPIHAPAINGPYVLQNTLALGNNNFLDLRKFNKRDIILSNQIGINRAIGITSAPTTTSTTLVPMPDMSTSIKTKGGPIRITAYSTVQSNSTSFSFYVMIYINGVSLGIMSQGSATVVNGISHLTSITSILVNSGVQKIDFYWKTDGATITAYLNQRTLLVEEI